MAWIVTPCVKSGRGCEFAWDGSPSALAPANKNLQTDALAPARVNSSLAKVGHGKIVPSRACLRR